MPGQIKRNIQQFRMSFGVTHSSAKVEGIMEQQRMWILENIYDFKKVC